MKENLKKNWFYTAAALLLFIMLTMAGASYSYAENYDVDLAENEGELISINFGTEYDFDTVTYYRIVPSKKGIVTFTAEYWGYAALCNADKKIISVGSYEKGDYLNGTSSYPYQRTISFGVKKGKTYYIRMTEMPGSKNEEGNYAASVKWTNTAVKAAKSGTKRSKAKAIKRNKTVKGLFVAGDKKAKWYKVTTNKKKTQFTLAAPNSNDGVKITLYYRLRGTSGRWCTLGPVTASRSGYKALPYLTQYRKSKYTVYVKVTPSGKSSGMYTLKWK